MNPFWEVLGDNSLRLGTLRFPLVSHSSKIRSSFSILRQKSQRRHPFSVLLESIKDTIVWDSSLRFSTRTFIRYDDQDHAGSLCN